MNNQNTELQEKDFIQEGYKKNPFPFWFWLFILTIIVALFWGGNSWYYEKIDRIFTKSPFLQVTNRQISLFLWQNPQYMRVNAKNKDAYLTGFQYINNVAPMPEKADEYVAAPPEVLFLYHTWDRLVKEETTIRPIPVGLFRRFLQHSQEWLPQYWSQASREYSLFINQLPALGDDELLSLKEIPKVVQIAFQGWRNYYIDAEEINQVIPSTSQMKAFLQAHPHYARNYWRNIFMASTPDYLKSIWDDTAQETLSKNELKPMLRVAFFNWLQMKESSSAPN